jgi:MFS family permease
MVSSARLASNPIEATTIRKLRIRLLPFLFALYVVAFIDRINLGFAALTMNPELAIMSQQFGFAAGIFFWGYFLFEIPSNLMLHKIGARVWVARILITWGTVATLTGFVQSASQLYIARFALGLSEAGYFPGIVLYLGYWFRQREKAQATALILMGIPLASVLGGPISGLILDHVHWIGLSSWRWLFILEGSPAVACAFLTYLLLPNRPAEAKFLTSHEKAWIADQLQQDDQQKVGARALSVVQTLIHPRVWHLACIGFGHGFATYTFSFWLPQILKSAVGGQSNTVVGMLVMIPNLTGLIAMILVSRHSDRRLERRYHMATAGTLSGIAMLLLGAPRSPLLSVVLFSVVAVGAYSFLPVFFSMPGEFLTGFSAAAGIALVTSIANFGGFVGPYTVGLIRERTGNPYYGLICAGVFFLLSASLALILPKRALPPSDLPSGTADIAFETGVESSTGGIMTSISKPIRIEPAFDEPDQIRAMFERHAPYRAVAAYAPEGLKDETREEAKHPVLPWFRGDWALDGKLLVEGAEAILHNKSFLEAARAAFGTPFVNPEFVAVNINGPMPAGATHIDNPSFYGATRVDYPLPFLRVMGFSGLFEPWRVVRASILSWFYEGAGGSFDYWPEGLDGAMQSEQPPFGNVALCADTDRMYHRIGPVGHPDAASPGISPAAQIHSNGDGSWSILENGEVRATYPYHAIRFSILWKAVIGDSKSNTDDLTLDRIMEILTADLRHRRVDFQLPSDPRTDTTWILMLQRIYAHPTATPGA